jgi:hypothetical protein
VKNQFVEHLVGAGATLVQQVIFLVTPQQLKVIQRGEMLDGRPGSQRRRMERPNQCFLRNKWQGRGGRTSRDLRGGRCTRSCMGALRSLLVRSLRRFGVPRAVAVRCFRAGGATNRQTFAGEKLLTAKPCRPMMKPPYHRCTACAHAPSQNRIAAMCPRQEPFCALL